MPVVSACRKWLKLAELSFPFRWWFRSLFQSQSFGSEIGVIDKLFPGLKITDLSPQQKELYTAAVQRQQQRLKEWYRWQLNPRSRNAGTVLSKKDLHTIYSARTRSAKPYEVFAKLYSQQVDDEKCKRCEANGVTGHQTLAVWHEVAKDLFDGATDEQKEEVKRKLEAVDPDSEGPAKSPAGYLRYLKKLPTLLDAAITPTVLQAGVLALVTIVGPDPEQNGKIVCKICQFGDKPETPLFSNDWDGHDTIFAEELARFARRHEFSPEICAMRSLNGMSISEKAPDGSSDDDSTSNPISSKSNTSKPSPSVQAPDKTLSQAQVMVPPTLDEAPPKFGTSEINVNDPSSAVSPRSSFHPPASPSSSDGAPQDELFLDLSAGGLWQSTTRSMFEQDSEDREDDEGYGADLDGLEGISDENWSILDKTLAELMQDSPSDSNKENHKDAHLITPFPSLPPAPMTDAPSLSLSSSSAGEKGEGTTGAMNLSQSSSDPSRSHYMPQSWNSLFPTSQHWFPQSHDSSFFPSSISTSTTLHSSGASFTTGIPTSSLRSTFNEPPIVPNETASSPPDDAAPTSFFSSSALGSELHHAPATSTSSLGHVTTPLRPQSQTDGHSNVMGRLNTALDTAFGSLPPGSRSRFSSTSIPSHPPATSLCGKMSTPPASSLNPQSSTFLQAFLHPGSILEARGSSANPPLLRHANPLPASPPFSLENLVPKQPSPAISSAVPVSGQVPHPSPAETNSCHSPMILPPQELPVPPNQPSQFPLPPAYVPLPPSQASPPSHVPAPSPECFSAFL
ncbi:hypothetical protein NMY22_g3475 [Coprinellus aureogranulatus]|nr:hypothetical protein NMY22_g3475 [Coprinellus aureogranulatus]